MRSFFLMLILLSAVAMAAPVPTASGTAPGEQMMGEGFSTTVCFTNTGDATGYAPAYEMVVPYGVTFDSAQFVGTSVKTTLVETCGFTQPGQTECNATNPLTGAVVQLDENASLYILEYPLGSMPTDMPRQCMDLSFTLASSPTVEIGVPLDLELTPFFSLGTDGEDNPQTDPPIYGTPELLPVIPVVFKITKTFNARENETVSGPHFAKSVTFALDVAAGETAENVLVTDDLPGELQYVALTDNGGCSVNSEPSTTVPGGTLSLDCGDITGVAGTDRTITFSFYVPENDADGNPVLDPQTGAFNTVLNIVGSTHDYNGTVYYEDANDTIVVKPVAIFKDMAIYEDNGVPGISPTDILEYNITVRLSDYFSIENMLFRDTLDNTQQDYHLQYGAYYIVHSASGDVTGDFNVSTSLLLSNDVNTGEEFLDFNLSKALLENGEDANLTGGDGITVTIRFLARILEEHRGDDVDYLAVKAGDHITNKASSSTDIVGGDTAPSDGTSTDSQIAKGEGGKSVYAINGDTNITPPYKVRPGDTVTFRLLVEFPIASFKDANITDYLPSPIFAAAEMNETDTPQYYRDATPPDAGRWSSGTLSDINLTGIQTHFLVNVSQNSIEWTTNPKTVDANVTRSGTIELFFTVTATGRPMADQLKLANLGTVSYENSKDDTIFGSDIVDVIAQEPSIVASQLKTIAGTTNPRSSFVIPPPADYNSSLKDVDANDTVTYRILIQNDGNSTAYQVSIRDRFGQGGIAGQGLANCNVKTTDNNTSGSVVSGDLFTDDLNVSKIDPKMGVRIVYECTVDPLHAPGDDINNTAELLHYASVPDGPNFVTKPMNSSTLLMLDTNATIVKTVAATSIPETAGISLNQGEIAYFDINVTLTEGTYTNFAVTDDTCVNRTLQATSANVAVSGTTVTVAGTEGSVDGNLSYRCEYQAVAGGTNTATVTSDQTTAKSDSASWTVVDPVVVTSKTMNPKQADAGDTVTVTMGWTNDTAHPAFKCRIEDPLDTAVFDTSAFAMTQTPSDYDCDLNTTNDTVICTYTGDLTKPCSDGPAKFTLKVRDDVNTSGTLTNEIGFYGVTLPDGHQGENNDTYNGQVESNATDTLYLRSPSKPVKVFTATSEAFTDLGDLNLNNTPDVAVGEVIDVQISYGFYEGTTLNADLDDVLDDPVYSYVPGTMEISRSDGNLLVEDSVVNAALGSVAVGSFVSIPDSSLSINDDRIRLHTGDIYNQNVTGTTGTESLTLHFRVKVQNESAVHSGVMINDRGRVRFEDSQTGTIRTTLGDPRAAKIVEPLMTIVKDANRSIVQAGSHIRYTIRLCNDEQNESLNPNHATSGFDWNISDRLPDEILPDGGYSVDAGTTGANVTVVQSGQELNATIDRLDRGECISIEYNATVQQSARYAQMLINTVRYTGTSLPGTYGMAGDLGMSDQDPGSLNGERTGSGGINDIFGQDDAAVRVRFGVFDKELLHPKPYYAIGEKAHYRIQIALPKGTTSHALMHDILPTGLDFNMSDYRVEIGPDINVTKNPPVVTQNGNEVIFDFGDLNVTGLSGIIIDYNTTVANIMSNRDGVVLQNNAYASYDDPNRRIILRPLFPAGAVLVGEPNLYIQKRITAGAAQAQAGSTVSWGVAITNNGHTTAYGVDWNDTLPSKIAQIANSSLTLIGTPAVVSGTTTPLQNSDLTENNRTISLTSFDLPVGSTVEIRFDSTVQDNAVTGEILFNETNASYHSLLGADGTRPGGRNGDDCGDDDDNSTLNNYCESAQAPLTIDSALSIDKVLQGHIDRFTIGELVTYEMRISLIEGITKNVVLRDTLPAGLQYVSHTHQNGAPRMTYDFASADRNSGTPQQVEIDFGDVSNPSDGDRTNDYIDVELTARVMNMTVNQDGYQPDNGNDAITPVVVTSDTNSSSVTVPVEIQIIEPDLKVTKSVSPATQSLGDVVTYRIDVRHTSESSSGAFDVDFTDTLPPEMSYIPGSATGAAVTQNGQQLNFGFAYLGQSEVQTVTYQARLSDTAPVGIDVNNSLDTVYGSLPDANGTAAGARNGDDGVGGALNDYALHTSAALTPNNYELNITKKVTWIEDRNNDGLVSIGDYLEYNLSINNPYTYSVGDVNFTDPLPIETTYLLNTLTLSDMANGNSVDDSDITEMKAWITELVAGETNYISFRVEINADVPAGTTITNVGYVDSNRTVPTPSNEANITTDARGFPGTPSKNIFDSSEPTTTLPNVAVGEVVDVNISFPFTGGTTKSVVLRDKFNADEFEYVANSMHLQRSSTGIRVSQSDLNASFGGGSLDIAVDDSNLTIDASGLALNVEDVANTDYNGLVPTEQLTMVFKLRVKNTASVNRDGTLNDRGEVEYALYHPDTNSSSTETIQTSAVGVTVNEPLPQVSKTNDKPAAAAGDTVTFTVKLCNDEAGTATDVASAFDWNATDVLPATLQPTGTPSVDGAPGTASFSGQMLSVSIPQIDQGQCATVTYSAVIQGTAQVDENITNTVRFETTSLPGTDSGERTGSGGVNDLHGFAQSQITIGAPSIAKDVSALQTYYPVGDAVEYNITVALPGSAQTVTVTDRLPDGLIYNTGSVRLVTAPGMTVGNNPPNVTQIANVIMFELGDVNITSAASLYLEFNATVDNVIGNQDGTQLVNSAELTYKDPATGADVTLPIVESAAITVGEPSVTMQKQVTSGAAGAQAGDTVGFSVVMDNSAGHTTAYAVQWSDIMPEHLAQIGNIAVSVSDGTAYLSGTTTPIGSADAGVTTTYAPDDTIALPPFDLSAGAKLKVTFDTVVQPDVKANEEITNETNSIWQSFLGSIFRDGSDGIGGALNDYAAEADATLNINANIAITKTLLGAASYTIGDEVIWRISVSTIAGVTEEVNVTDYLPAGLEYVRHTHQPSAPTMRYDTVSADVNEGNATRVVISLGDINNTGSADDTIDIELTARVLNLMGNQNGIVPSNGDTAAGSPVSVRYSVQRPSVPRAASRALVVTEANVTTPAPFTIVEPDLQLTKTVNPPSQALGKAVTYHIELRHTPQSTATAYDVNFTDTLPVNLSYIPGSAAGAVVTQDGQRLTFNVPVLQLSDVVNVTYQARIAAAADTNTTLLNEAEAVYGSLPDANGTRYGARNGDDRNATGALNDYFTYSNAPVRPNRDDFVVAIKEVYVIDDNNSDNMVNAGDALRYEINITNTGSYTVGDVHFEDIVPVETTYLIGTLRLSDYAGGANTVDESNTSMLIADIEQMVAGEMISVWFDVRINDDVPGGVTILNQAVVDSNRTIPYKSSWPGDPTPHTPTPITTVNVPLFDTDTRMALMAMMLLSGAAMLYRRRRERK